MKETKVFVYGTLMQGFGNHQVVSDFVKEIHPGSIKGRLYHLPAGYPAISLEKGTVLGEVITLKHPEEALTQMDYLEGYRGPDYDNLYDRVVVEVTTNSSTEEAFAYVWPEKDQLYLQQQGIFIDHGDWKKFINEGGR